MALEKIIKGKVYVVGDDIDTDVIIPACYLTSMDPEKLKPHLFESLENKKPYEEGMNIIIAGKNFGCGSSREHAPIAIHAAGFEAVVAPTFARIFYRNCINGGLLLPLESTMDLTEYFKTGDYAEIEVYEVPDIKSHALQRLWPLRSFDNLESEILEAGGLTKYNKKKFGL